MKEANKPGKDIVGAAYLEINVSLRGTALAKGQNPA